MTLEDRSEDLAGVEADGRPVGPRPVHPDPLLCVDWEHTGQAQAKHGRVILEYS